MWFRNLMIYSLDGDLDLSPERLESALSANAFTPCGGLQAQSLGWVSPLGRDGATLTQVTDGRILVCLRREERLLPAAVIREALEERVAEIEARESRDVSRKEKTQLRDEIQLDLLPRAFTRSSRIFAYLDPVERWLVVDSASANRAEELVSLLRESLGSFPARPLKTADAPAALMTAWLQQGAPIDFELQDECELRAAGEEGGVVRCRRQALDSEEIATHLAAGKAATRLALEWKERIGCVLGEDLVIRRLRFLEGVQDGADNLEAADPAARLDADFALMALELRAFIKALLEVLGGPAPTEPAKA